MWGFGSSDTDKWSLLPQPVLGVPTLQNLTYIYTCICVSVCVGVDLYLEAAM